jgi:hypothetical protein
MSDDADITEATRWRQDGWTARILKNDEDDGWAVEMTRDGDPGPALTGPWTMGRDKKNPKPLDRVAFLTLVKTANDVLRRAEHHASATRRRQMSLRLDDGRRVMATLTVDGDDDDAAATLSCVDEATGREFARRAVEASFRFDRAHLTTWLAGVDAD